jgi:hypothetical protein
MTVGATQPLLHPPMSFLPASSCWLPYCFNGGLAGWHIALMVITKIMMIIDYFSSYVWLATVIKAVLCS